MSKQPAIILPITMHDEDPCPYCTTIDLANAFIAMGLEPSAILDALVRVVAVTVAQGSPTEAAREANIKRLMEHLPLEIAKAIATEARLEASSDAIH